MAQRFGYRLTFWLGSTGMAAAVLTGLAAGLAAGGLPSLDQDPLARARELADADPAALLSEYRDFVAIQPRDANAHMQLGTLLASRGDEAGATAVFEEILTLQPVPPAAHAKLASLYYRSGRTAEARAQARLALEGGARVPDVLLRKLRIPRSGG